ncbi:MAG: DoxX family protein [Opitutaceae bacterium]|nr:DoxX family protein [Opitutaceae bacterium]
MRAWLQKFESFAARQRAAVFLLRVSTGVLLCWYHGIPKLVAAHGYFTAGEPWKDVGLVAELGLPFPALSALAAGLIQSLGSILMAAGLYTRTAAVLIASTLFVAVVINLMHGKDNQVAFLYLFASLTIVLQAASHAGNPKPA